MELEAFGQSIEIQMDQKNIMVLSGVLGVLIVVLVASFFIVPKVQDIVSNKTEIQNVKNKLRNQKTKYQNEKKKVDKLVSIYDKQKDNLALLEEKFQKASLRDVLELKISIQKMIDYLNIDVASVGGSQTQQVEKKGYIKEYIPYEVNAHFYQIARLFYYLENSKDWLLTFGKSGFVMNSKNDEGVLNIKFKIGAYIKEGNSN